MIVESQKVEFKQILNERFERSAVAFLNSNTGGAIYIGVSDDGDVVGLENIDKMQLQIADRLKNNISPSVLGLFDIVLEEQNGLKYLKVFFSSGSEKPYYLKKIGMTPDGCFIRVGSQTQNLTPQMIENLFARRTRNNIRVIEAPRQDLTFSQLKIFYEEHKMPLNDQFPNNLEFYTPDMKYNILAYLFADQNGVSIKVAKYKGTNKVDLIENEEYGYCSLLKATDRVLDKLRVEDRTFTKITAKYREETPMYDFVATREAVINAFVHNDYSDLMTPVFELFSDRLEITSYGGLIDGMTRDELVSGISRPRNREIMRIYRDMELVEQLGSGMNRMMKSYSPDIFKITPNFFHVVLFFNDKNEGTVNGGLNDTLNERINERLNDEIIGGLNGELNERINERLNERINERLNLTDAEIDVLKEICNNPYIKTNELVNALGLSMATVSRIIKSLRENNVIIRRGSKKTGHWEIIHNNDNTEEKSL